MVRRYDVKKREAIIAVLDENPGLSNRAVAKLAGVDPVTVAKAKSILGIDHLPQVEASGRRARGQRQVLRYYEDEPSSGDEKHIVYRAFNEDRTLLYVGMSISFLARFANHSRKPWWHEIAEITLTHFPSWIEAEHAERTAIWTENPKYNVQRRKPRPTVQKLLYEKRRDIGPKTLARAIEDARKKAPPSGHTPGMIKRPTG